MKDLLTRPVPHVLLLATLACCPVSSLAQFSINISVQIAPPALPVYVQPPCPQPNYMWTPGYWAWDPDEGDYFWVPGTWVLAPQPGYLWTPGYWGYGDGGLFVFHPGYWGTQVGFYGGVNYGFGYGGGGFAGGEWRGGVFAYNTAAVNVNTTVIRNTYVNTTVINNTTIINNNHVSFNGGPNGVAARPTPQQEAIARQPHLQATPAQQQHMQVARQDRSNFASANHGVPAHAAVAKPVANVAELQHSAVAARPAPGAKPYVAKPVAATQPGTRAGGQPAGQAPAANRVGGQPAGQSPAANRGGSNVPAANHPQPAVRPPAAPVENARPTQPPPHPQPAPRPATPQAAKPAPRPAPAEKGKEPPPRRPEL